MKIKSIEEAVRSGPFKRFSRYRENLLSAWAASFPNHVLVNGRVYEASTHTDDDLINELNSLGFTVADLQYIVDVANNPAIKDIKYKEFTITTATQADRDELKAMVEPYLKHKGTLIEPIYFNGKQPFNYRVVAYDDLITQLQNRYMTMTINVVDDNGAKLVPDLKVVIK